MGPWIVFDVIKCENASNLTTKALKNLSELEKHCVELYNNEEAVLQAAILKLHIA
jgi:hypothetical protein